MVNYYSIENILESCSIETENKWNNLFSKDIENIINDMLFETIEMKKKKMTDELKNIDTKYYHMKKMLKDGFFYSTEGVFVRSNGSCNTMYRNVFSISRNYYRPNRKIKIRNGIEIMGGSTVKDLKQSCKINNLKKYSRLKRKELIQLLMSI